MLCGIPNSYRRIVDEGHELASHGWSHKILVFASPTAIRRELNETAAVFTGTGAPRPRFFRAPHGFRGPFLNRVAGGLGYRLVGWSKGVFDTALPGADTIVERAQSGMHPGAVLLLHDADGNGTADRSQTAEALPGILQQMQARGLQPVTISELSSLESPSRFSWERMAIGGIALSAFIALFVHHTGVAAIDATIEIFAGVNLALVAAAVLANLVSVFFKAIVWREAIDLVPRRPAVRFVHVVAAIFVGFLVNSIFVARSGEVARAVVLRRRIARDSGGDMAMATLAGTIVVETIVLAATLLLLLGVMVFAAPDVPPQVAVGSMVLLGLITLCLLALAGVGLAQRHAKIRDHEQSTTWLGRNLGRIIHELHQGHVLLTDWRRLSFAISAGVLSWAANLLAIWLTLLAFGMDDHALGAAVLVFAVSNLVGLVQITPGNVAVFQVAVAIALSQAYGVERAAGLSFGVGLQAIEISLGAGLGLAFLAREGLSLAEVRSEVSALADSETPSGLAGDSVLPG